MILGMGKGRISRILAVETFFIGVISLAAGLLAGIGLSQLMSAIVAQLFEADMSGFTFVFSVNAFVKTIIYFSVIMTVVAVFDLVMIGKARLIDLMNTGSRTEKVHMKNPVVCIVVFMISAALLAYDYYIVTSRFMLFLHTGSVAGRLALIFGIGAVCTFLFSGRFPGFCWGLFPGAKACI